MNPAHALAELLARPAAASSFDIELPAALGQGRAIYGGALATLAVRAMQAELDPARALRSLQISFVGPVAPGLARVESTVLRSGANLSQSEARVLQDGKLCALAVASFGRARESQAVIAADPLPRLPPPDGLDEMPYIPGVTPEFTRQIAYRWNMGAPPFSGTPAALVGGWCRIRGLQTPMGGAEIFSLIDAWPAPVLCLLPKPAPASTVCWSTHLVSPLPPAAPDDWWLYRSTSTVSADGYADLSASLWHQSGVLVARTTQTVAVFA